MITVRFHSRAASEGLALFVLLLVVIAPACVHGQPAPVGAENSWLVGVSTGGWFETFDQNAGGIGVQAAVAKAVRSHMLVGGRVTGLTEIDINNPPKQNVASLFDVGPVIGTGASWSRLSVSASGGPLLTHVKYADGAWKSSWTVGLGMDAGVTVRAFGFVGVGVHVLENFNPKQSATGVALRIEGSVW